MNFLRKLFGGKRESENNQTKSSTEISVRSAAEQSNRAMQQRQPILSIHPDIRDLIWIGDGNFKNYISTSSQKTVFQMDGVSVTISFGIEEEPSLLLLRLPISDSKGDVERPPYYPTYKELTPEQRGIYWRLLANPYDNTIDIGYVFILYYGLERYLLTDQYEKAVDVILRLRDKHPNKSFQMYSANAVILTCIIQKRADIVQKFMNSLDKEYEFSFSPNLYLLCKHALGLPITAADVMRMAKAFEFTKNNYIKKYPDMFIKTLSLNISDKYKEEVIPWERILSNTDFKKLPTEEATVFANISIRDKMVRVPSLLSSFKLKKSIYDLLDKTHEDVKRQLAELKKEGKQISENNPPVMKAKSKEELVFDTALERKLRDAYNKAHNPEERHFASILLQDFYYKYRNLDRMYLQECITYCMDDISCLPELQKSYKERERKRILSNSLLTKSEIQQRISEIEPFLGSIPAFKRLAIVYEKEKDYDNAIDICNQAIAYYSSIGLQSLVSEFDERYQKLVDKKH